MADLHNIWYMYYSCVIILFLGYSQFTNVKLKLTYRHQKFTWFKGACLKIYSLNQWQHFCNQGKLSAEWPEVKKYFKRIIKFYHTTYDYLWLFYISCKCIIYPYWDIQNFGERERERERGRIVYFLLTFTYTMTERTKNVIMQHNIVLK